MCDQDHFEDDRQQYEALGLVTRKPARIATALAAQRKTVEAMAAMRAEHDQIGAPPSQLRLR
jgi:hypothetical protein